MLSVLLSHLFLCLPVWMPFLSDCLDSSLVSSNELFGLPVARADAHSARGQRQATVGRAAGRQAADWPPGPLPLPRLPPWACAHPAAPPRGWGFHLVSWWQRGDSDHGQLSLLATFLPQLRSLWWGSRAVWKFLQSLRSVSRRQGFLGGVTECSDTMFYHLLPALAVSYGDDLTAGGQPPFPHPKGMLVGTIPSIAAGSLTLLNDRRTRARPAGSIPPGIFN